MDAQKASELNKELNVKVKAAFDRMERQEGTAQMVMAKAAKCIANLEQENERIKAAASAVQSELTLLKDQKRIRLKRDQPIDRETEEKNRSAVEAFIKNKKHRTDTAEVKVTLNEQRSH